MEEFGEFFQEWKPQPAAPNILSFEGEKKPESPPPDFVLGHEHGLGLHLEIRETLFWPAYRLVHPSAFEKEEKLSKQGGRSHPQGQR